MSKVQPGIMAPVPPLARYLEFDLLPGSDASASLQELAARVDPAQTVVGIGLETVLSLGRSIPGLRDFPVHTGAGFAVPSTPAALWCWLHGEDRGDLLHRTRALESGLSPAFALTAVIDAFRHGDGRDLTGYEDGTENPRDAAAHAAAVAGGLGRGLDGGSYVAVQQWLHDFERFDSLRPRARDAIIGRRRSDNVELADAPDSAHVKRTAQESFAPPAFVLRRSMPWAEGAQGGLVFVAFGRSFDAFEAQLRRMVGRDDGVHDALFGISRPLTGAYFWCPPVAGGQLDLRALSD